MVLGSLFYQTAIIRAEEWFWNQGWFCNQNRMILKPKPMILQPRMILKPKKWFWNQGWFRNQGHLETKMAWFSNEAVCISVFFEASSWLCHLDTCPSGDDAMLSVAASVSEEGTQLPGRYCPTPPPPASGDDAMLTVAAIVTRMLVSESCGWWLGNGLFLVAKSSLESPFFGCGIGYFWLRKRLFWLRKRVWFWLRNRRNLVAEASKYGFGIGIYSIISNDLRLHSGQGIFAAGKVGEVVALALWCTAQCLLQLLLQCNRAVIMLLLCLILLG